MITGLADQPFTPWFHTPNIRTGVNPVAPLSMLTESPLARPTTGTEDDHDEPEDEHDGENEANQREAVDIPLAALAFEINETAVISTTYSSLGRLTAGSNPGAESRGPNPGDWLRRTWRQRVFRSRFFHAELFETLALGFGKHENGD